MVVGRIRAHTIAPKFGPILSSLTIFHIEPIYTHIFTCHNHVITMSYLKYCCILMWYYVFAIKIKYYGRKKVRHIAIPLHCYYDYSVFPSIHIVFPKSPILPYSIQTLKKRSERIFCIEPVWLSYLRYIHIQTWKNSLYNTPYTYGYTWYCVLSALHVCGFWIDSFSLWVFRIYGFVGWMC